MGLIVDSWVRNAWTLWASRLALFSLQLVCVAFVLHRTHLVSTSLALGLMAVSGALAILGGLIAFVGFVQIWNNGGKGGLRGTFAVAVMLATLAVPLSYLPKATSLPLLNDVSTDLVTPPGFFASSAAPAPSGFMSADRSGPNAPLQQAGYPDVRPIIVDRTVAAAFDAARAIAEREGLEIVQEVTPRGAQRSGRIQAFDETLVMGFRDDVVIRVRPQGKRSRIDLRSASRYGQHDFGRNAERIRNLTRQLRARLDFQLPASLEDEPETTKPVASKPKRSVKPKAKRKTVRRRRKARNKRRRRSRSTDGRAQARKALQRQ